MRKRGKCGLVLMLAAAAMGVLAGCSGKTTDAGKTEASTGAVTVTEVPAKEDTSAAAASQAAVGDKVTLRFSWWGGDSRHEATLKAIEEYEKLNPNVKIEAEYMGYDGYYEKMMTTLSSGTAPDLFQFHRDWLADVQGADHYLADLSKLPMDLKEIDSGLLERSGSFNGEPVLYSCSIAGQVLYINEDFFTSHELDPNIPFTWESLMEAGKKIHEANPEEYLMTADIDVLNRLLVLNYLSQTTGESLVNQEDHSLQFTAGQMEASLQNIKDLYDTGTMEPFGESAVFVGVMEQNTKWVNGKIGVLFDISSALDKYKASVDAKIGVMTLPNQEGSVCSGVDYSGNMGFSVNDKSPNKEEAAKFLNWMSTSPDAIKLLTTCRGVPAAKTARATLEKEGLLDPVLQKASEIIEPNSYSINAISSNTELETIRKDVIQEVIYGDLTPAQGAEEIVKQYEKVLNNLK